MTSPSLDPSQVYQERDSLVHRLDPRTRVLLCLLFVLAVNLAGPWPLAGGLLLALLVAASTLSRLGPFYAWPRSLIVLPFILAALPLAFTTPGPPLLHLPVLGTASGPGAMRVLALLVKAWLSVQAAVLLGATTRFPDLMAALSALGLPRTLATIIGLAYRYLFLLADEVTRMTRARRCRSAQQAGSTARRPPLAWRAQVSGRMAGTLFLRSLERSERVYVAMAARGYDGRVRTLRPFRLRLADVGFLVGAVAALAAVVLLSRIAGP